MQRWKGSSLLHSLSLMGALGLFASGFLLAQDSLPRVGNSVVRMAQGAPITTAVAVNVSGDELATTILMSNCSTTLGITETYLTTSTHTVVHTPITVTTQSPTVAFTAVIRGFVTKSADTRVSFFLDFGGSTHQFEFPYGQVFSGDFIKGFATTLPVRQFVPPPDPLEPDEREADSSSATTPTTISRTAERPTSASTAVLLQYCETHIVTVAQRLNPGEQAHATIDSVDILAVADRAQPPTGPVTSGP